MFKSLYFHYGCFVSYKVISSLVIVPVVEEPVSFLRVDSGQRQHSKLTPKIALLSMVTFALGVSSFGLNVSDDDERATYILVVVFLSIIECLSILSIIYPEEEDMGARDVMEGTNLRRNAFADRAPVGGSSGEYKYLLSSIV